MNKNAFINAACALLGAGGRGFVKALAFVLLGAFCAPVFSFDPYIELRNEKDPVVICKMYGLYHNGKCHVYYDKGKGSFRGAKPQGCFIQDEAGVCVFSNEEIVERAKNCVFDGRGCPYFTYYYEFGFKGGNPKYACGTHLSLGANDPLLADIRKAGVLDYIKRNFNVADEQRAIKNACRVILGEVESLFSGVGGVEYYKGTCKTEKAGCMENSYCPYKDSEYEAGLRELEESIEPLAALAEEAKKCIKDTENFLNPAAATE